MTDTTTSNGNGSTPLSEATTLETQELKIRELSTELGHAGNNMEIMQEALAELELALEDVGWQRLSGFGDREFSMAGLKRIRRMARLSYLKNPLIRHGVEVQAHYVWGQGCNIAGGSEEVNDVVQDFLDDPKNVVSLTGHQARLDLERELQLHGDLFLPLFTNKNNGRVVVRKIFPDEVFEIITNPDDYMEPWFYKREYQTQTFNSKNGAIGTKSKVCYYPDWRLTYNTDPSIEKPQKIGGNPVMWDAPIYHVKVGGLGDQKFGCPEVYPALDWASAVKSDLEDYATLKRAHARYAFSLTTKGGKLGVAAAKARLATTLNASSTGSLDTNPPPAAGATFIGAEGWNLAPVKTAGALPSPEEGKRMGLMVAAGMGIPETILFGNADAGSLATAKTLDRPTELKMENRRTLWADIYVDILGYVIDQAIIAPNGMLDGEFVTDDDGYEARAELDDEDASRTIDVSFPSILQRDVLVLVQAIVAAATLGNSSNAGLIPDVTIARLLLNALGQDDIDESLAEIYPDNILTFDAGAPDPTAVPNPAAGAPGVASNVAAPAIAGNTGTTSTGSANSQPKQGVRSTTGAGLGNMGDNTSQGGAGISVPVAAGGASLVASLRELKSALAEEKDAPIDVTEFEYDDQGRVIRKVEHKEFS